MGRRLRRLRRVLLVVPAVLVGLAGAAALVLTLTVRGSLPRLDGTRELAGLRSPVTVTRDSLGVPDVAAADRADAACALGYLHAQDRFFQMDLQRRTAAGELAALLGPPLLDQDRDHRRHRFRNRARAVVATLSGRDQEVVQAYAAGVNAGLGDLAVRPWEYVLLRQRPEPWRPEDTVLTIYAMFLDLARSTAHTELARANVDATLPPALAAFLLPAANRWEAPLETGGPHAAPVPDSSLVDVRRWVYGGRTWRSYLDVAPADTAGSNSWAVAGALTGHGGAIVANDMHLSHGLPNIWYRARVSWPEGSGRRSVVGVTLPGTPAIVTGSNGDVAWGFTNSYGDWLDLVVVPTDTTDASRYLAPDGWRAFTRHAEVIAVAGGPADTLTVTETIWGPLWATDIRGRSLALRWTAHDVEAVNLGLMDLETARNVDQAVTAAARAGIPPQNLVCADRHGRIAWTIAGRMPRRVGWDGQLPASWADGDCGWDGYREPSGQPRLVDPPAGRVWTANNRVTAGDHLATIGHGGYALGARARQIRDALRALERPTEPDMLALQLDDRAVFLGEWRDLLLSSLERREESLTAEEATFLRVVRDDWDGRADVGSVSYRLLRDAVYGCIDEIYGTLTGPCRAADGDFRPRWLPYRHEVTWRLLTLRPAHLLPPGNHDWDDVVRRAAAGAVALAGDAPLAHHTWGGRNVVEVAHPFTLLDRRLARWLAAPARPLPGDSFMPRVQHRTSGASERMVVSPGREEHGIFHMPGGQSGHFLSPYFLAGHEAWATGRATPLLPGPAVHRLELVPD